MISCATGSTNTYSTLLKIISILNILSIETNNSTTTPMATAEPGYKDATRLKSWTVCRFPHFPLLFLLALLSCHHLLHHCFTDSLSASIPLSIKSTSFPSGSGRLFESWSAYEVTRRAQQNMAVTKKSEGTKYSWCPPGSPKWEGTRPVGRLLRMPG